MIGTIEIRCYAAQPQKPLPPVFSFRGSPSSLRILDVPRRIGEWQITAVKVAATYPDNSLIVQDAVRTGNVWVATFAGCDVSGKTANGLQIIADGTNENGEPVTGYVLGCGDLYILNRDASIAADGEKWYVRYCDEAPENPATGDLIIANGSVKIYDGSQWVTVEPDLSAYATKQELNSAMQGVLQSIPTKTSDLRNDSGFVDGTTLNTALAPKQDKLSEAQVSAIDTVVDERKTVVSYTDGTTAELDIVGELTSESIPHIYYASNVVIGSAVTRIQTGVFRSTNLTSIKIPNSITSIMGAAFMDCKNIRSMTIGDGVTSIGGAAFYNCSGLTSVTIGNGVTSIGSSAFTGCSGLTSVTFLGKTIEQVQNIEDESGTKQYPWGIEDTSIITTWNDASQEWVTSQIPTKTSDLTNDSGFITLDQTRYELVDVAHTSGLHDRAINYLQLTSDTTLELPMDVSTERCRDFLLYIDIPTTLTTVPTLTFDDFDIEFYSDSDTFPKPDSTGKWLYSFTEIAVANTTTVFAVSLKKLNRVQQS